MYIETPTNRKQIDPESETCTIFKKPIKSNFRSILIAAEIIGQFGLFYCRRVTFSTIPNSQEYRKNTRIAIFVFFLSIFLRFRGNVGKIFRTL